MVASMPTKIKETFPAETSRDGICFTCGHCGMRERFSVEFLAEPSTRARIRQRWRIAHIGHLPEHDVGTLTYLCDTCFDKLSSFIYLPTL